MISVKRLELINSNLNNTDTRQDQKHLVIQYYSNFSKIILKVPRMVNLIEQNIAQSLYQNKLNIESRKYFWMQGAGNQFFYTDRDIAQNIQKNHDYEQKKKIEEIRLKLLYMMHKIKTIGIVHWNGLVMGNGIGVSATAPFRIATQKTIFTCPQIKFAFYANSGAGYFLPKLKGKIGYYLALTGQQLIGQEVYIAGAANYFIPSTKIETVYNQIKEKIEISSLSAFQTIKLVLSKYHQQPKINKLKNEDRINYIFESKTIDGILQRIDSKISNDFHYKIKKIMENLSPSAVVLNFMYLQKCQNISFKQVIQLEYRVTSRRIRDNDTKNAILKKVSNQKTQWSHEHILEVKSEEIDNYFKPLQKQLVLITDH